jgi:hypothetical protein
MTSVSPVIKMYLAYAERAQTYPRWLKAIANGLWLGLLTRGQMHVIDRVYYERTSYYTGEAYNKSGFFDWERKAFLEYFQSCQTILVAAVGGGREVFILNELGFETDGFECNPKLFEFAENLFRDENIAGEFRLVPRDEVWHFGKVYDGAIIGWAAYMMIHTKGARITFLKKMRAQLNRGAPLLASFYARDAADVYFKRVLAVGNCLRFLLGREKLELGDDLTPASFAHRFTEDEIREEFARAGFKLIFYSAHDYGHAVAVAV